MILCVIPANIDVSTSDGLKLAREVDPNGDRTIGVITKIDIMDRGTNAKKVLLNQDIPLKLGYVAIKNRCQADIQEKKTVKVSLNEEKKWFEKHPVYSTISSEYWGTESLTFKLVKLLYTHIKKCLPTLMKQIDEKVNSATKELGDLGIPLPTTTTEKYHFLWDLITRFSKSFQNSIEGKFDRNAFLKDPSFTIGGSILSTFKKMYSNICEKGKNPSSEYSDSDIKRVIQHHEGDNLPGFASFDAFYYLLEPILDRVRNPTFECLEEVHQQLQKVALSIIEKLCTKFFLYNIITKYVGALLLNRS